MNRTLNLEAAIMGLESNICRLRNDIAARESANMDIYCKWIYYTPGSRARSDMELGADLHVTEYNNGIILENERHLKAQIELHAKLLHIYGIRLQADFSRIFMAN